MAKGNLPACLAVTLPHEGGYVDHPADPGGATNLGITHKTLAAWRGAASVTKDAVRSLTLREATAIYEARYWNAVRGDALPYGVDLAVFDYGVNSGPSRSIKGLQRVVGASVDGDIGPETIRKTLLADGKATVQGVCRGRMSFLGGLPTWETFKRGWSRRVADVEAKGVAMWMARGAPLAAKDRQALEDESVKAGKAAQTQDRGAGTVGTGGGGTVGVDTIANGEPNWMLIAGVVIVVGLVVIGLVMKARQNKARAKAYAEVAYKG